jgi:hypothetical protein
VRPYSLFSFGIEAVNKYSKNFGLTSLLTVVSSTSASGRYRLRLWYVLERIYRPSREPLSATNTSHRKQGTVSVSFKLSHFAHKISNRMLLFGSTFL